MTTVAYKDGVMACDSRCSDYGRHLTKCQKIFRLKSGALLGVCGDVDVRDLIELLDNVRHADDIPTREDLAELRHEGDYILVLPNGDIWSICIDIQDYEHTDEWKASAVLIQEDFASIGSGSHLAIGAMEFGASAKEAVECAAKWDLYSAPPIQTMKLVEKEKGK